MSLDAKQKVLLALYLEQQRELPENGRVRPETLGIAEKAFYAAYNKLELEGYVSVRDVEFSANKIYDAKITKSGIDMIEAAFSISTFMSGPGKIKAIIANAKQDTNLQSAFEFIDSLVQKLKYE